MPVKNAQLRITDEFDINTNTVKKVLSLKFFDMVTNLGNNEMWQEDNKLLYSQGSSTKQIPLTGGVAAPEELGTDLAEDKIVLLDSTGRIPIAAFPAYSLFDIVDFPNVAARDASHPTNPTIGYVIDIQEAFIYTGTSWQPLNIDVGVRSVNTRTGIVTVNENFMTWVNARGFNGAIQNDITLSSAISSIGAGRAILYIGKGTSSGVWNINNSLTIPSNIDVMIDKGVVFFVGSGNTLTFNGQLLEHKSVVDQIFSGVGTVRMPATKFFRPEWWGASPDGVVDCANSISSIIKEHIDPTIILQEGTYLCSPTIELPHASSNLISFDGEGVGRSSVIKVGSAIGAQVFLSGPTCSYEFTDLTLDYSLLPASSAHKVVYADGIKAYECTFKGIFHSTLAYQSIIDSSIDRAICGRGTSPVNLKNCEFNGCGISVYLEECPSSMTVVKDCLFQNWQNHAIYITSSAGGGGELTIPSIDMIAIKDNQILNGYGNGIVVRLNERNCQNLVIEGNEIDKFCSTGIKIDDNSDGGPLNLLIQGNNIRQDYDLSTDTREPVASDGGIVVGVIPGGDCSVRIKDNSIKECGAFGIKVGGLLAGSLQELIIEGNSLLKIWGSSTSDGIGIETSSTLPHAIIAHNHVLMSLNGAIALSVLGPDCIVSDNKVRFV